MLFDYISGPNKSFRKIKMTTPVTQSTTDGKIIKRFFLPQKYSKQNSPVPINERISFIDLPVEYFAVITYSGCSSEDNFENYYTELKTASD